MAYHDAYHSGHFDIAPARAENERRDQGSLVQLGPVIGDLKLRALRDLPALLEAGDVAVLNDAATLPASLRVRCGERELELRLLSFLGAARFEAVLFGDGDHRVRTEHRAAPPFVEPGVTLRLADGSARVERVSALSPRLLEISFDREGAALWSLLYRCGRPVQYAHEPRPLDLWSVQTLYAGEPWAVEMPSAGRPLSFQVLMNLRQRGVELAVLTHAAGLSVTGDPALDAALPMPERYRIPASTARKLAAARAKGRRVLAVGTSVVRALEGAARVAGGAVEAGDGITDLRIDGGHELRVVDGLLTGLHTPGESHYELLAAFTEKSALALALGLAERSALRSHEFGDSMLVWRSRGMRR